jgi:hypothetical protein
VGAMPPGSTKTFKLRIDLVPKPLHGHNLRSEAVGLGNTRWRMLRQKVLTEHGSACAICGSTEKPHTHEIWKYEERGKQGTARLLGIEVTCARCHYVHHWCSTRLMVSEGKMQKVSVDALIQHFMDVNECSRQDFERHASDSLLEWKRRNKLKWRIDWEQFSKPIKEARRKRGPVQTAAANLKIRCPNPKCQQQIPLNFPAQHIKTRKRQGIHYARESCKLDGQLELGPGTLGVSIIRGALVLFMADADSPEWKQEIGG